MSLTPAGDSVLRVGIASDCSAIHLLKANSD